MEELSLIDVSSSEDHLNSSSRDGLIDQSSSVIVGSEEGESQVKMSEQMEQAPQLSKTPELKKWRSAKRDLQKSLDWDRDFFTSEGVLNQEELAIMNSTFKKSEACSLSTILENPRKTAESNSTLDDDSQALENLEVDLFENVQASIQKTLGTGENALKLADPSKKNNPEKGNAQLLGSSMKVEPSLQNKKKSPVASERHGVSNHLHQHTLGGIAVVANVGAHGITSSKTVSKPTKILSRSLTMSAKTSTASGNSQIRTSNTKDKPGNVVTQKPAMIPKKVNGGPFSGISKSLPSLKSTLNSVSNSSDTAQKSPVLTRTRSMSRTTNRSSSGSITNKASMRTSGTKISSKNVSPNSSVMSSTAATPSSSFDSLTSGSSSSTLFAIKSLGDGDEASSSCRSLEGADSDKVHSPGLKSHLSSEHQGDHSCRLYVTKSPPDGHVTSEPSIGNNPRSFVGISGAKCNKPSAKKSQACNIRTISQTSQQHKQHNLPKSPTTRITKTDSANKPKLSKTQHTAPARSTARSRTPSMESLTGLCSTSKDFSAQR